MSWAAISAVITVAAHFGGGARATVVAFTVACPLAVVPTPHAAATGSAYSAAPTTTTAEPAGSAAAGASCCSTTGTTARAAAGTTAGTLIRNAAPRAALLRAVEAVTALVSRLAAVGLAPVAAARGAATGPAAGSAARCTTPRGSRVPTPAFVVIIATLTRDEPEPADQHQRQTHEHLLYCVPPSYSEI